MYRNAARLLIRSAGGGSRGRAARPFSTADLAAEPVEDSAFVDAWKKVSPNIDPPKTPLSFMKPRPPTPASIPSKLTVNFVLPYQSEISSKEVYPGAWTTVLVSPENVGVWNVRTENLDTWSLRQEMYVGVVNPEANGKIELPVPDNALYCGLLMDMQKLGSEISKWYRSELY